MFKGSSHPACSGFGRIVTELGGFLDSATAYIRVGDGCVMGGSSVGPTDNL